MGIPWVLASVRGNCSRAVLRLVLAAVNMLVSLSVAMSFVDVCVLGTVGSVYG